MTDMKYDESIVTDGLTLEKVSDMVQLFKADLLSPWWGEGSHRPFHVNPSRDGFSIKILGYSQEGHPAI